LRPAIIIEAYGPQELGLIAECGCNEEKEREYEHHPWLFVHSGLMPNFLTICQNNFGENSESLLAVTNCSTGAAQLFDSQCR
jgi:hypothetical protein